MRSEYIFPSALIAHCFCEIDEMEEDKPCMSDACRYYVRRKDAQEGAAQ